MKLIRFGEAGKERPGVCINDECYDVSGFIHDFDERFFANGGLSHLTWMIDQNKSILRKMPENTR